MTTAEQSGSVEICHAADVMIGLGLHPWSARF